MLFPALPTGLYESHSSPFKPGCQALKDVFKSDVMLFTFADSLPTVVSQMTAREITNEIRAKNYMDF